MYDGGMRTCVSWQEFLGTSLVGSRTLPTTMAKISGRIELCSNQLPIAAILLHSSAVVPFSTKKKCTFIRFPTIRVFPLSCWRAQAQWEAISPSRPGAWTRLRGPPSTPGCPRST